MRVAVGSIFTECSELGGVAIELDRFERHELLRGEELLSIDDGVVGGMLEVLRDRACTPVPLLWASCPPGGCSPQSATRNSGGSCWHASRLHCRWPLYSCRCMAPQPYPEGAIWRGI